MKEIVRELIEEGEDLYENHQLEMYEFHVDDLYLKFTTKSQLLFRKLGNDPLGISSQFSLLKCEQFDLNQLHEVLNLLKKAECYFQIDSRPLFWSYLHPLVTKLAQDKFEHGFYADAVESVFKEINSIIKHHYKTSTGIEEDGATLMNRAFSVNNPIFQFADITTETGKNIQQGYMQIFAGAMTGIRNPKAHNNMSLDPQKALHLLYVGSFMALKLEDLKMI